MGLYQPTPTDKERYKDLSVCILTPSGGYQSWNKFMKSVANMVAYSWMNDLKVYQMGMTERMVVDWARNDLARTATNHLNEYDGQKFTHLLWLDDDHTFNPDLAVYLARHDVDMVSGLYYGRTHPHYPVVYVKDTTDDKFKHFPIIETPNTLFECDAVGFGAMFMKREVFEKVPEPWFTLDWQAGEDIAFCVKAKEHGVKIYCEGSYKLGHIGVPPVITEADYIKAQKDNPDLFGEKIKVSLGGKT